MNKALSLLALLSSSALATPQTINPLDVPVRTVYPDNVTTVRDAVEWFIEPLSYTLITDYPAPPSASAILNRPIPAKAKLHRTMPVLHAVQLLIGEDNVILLDKRHQLMSFQTGAKKR